ncbi:MAG TPA: TerC family protein [Saprospiraceae bacterium]|nr:TerC family protein [Saprospiraceae bacterium]
MTTVFLMTMPDFSSPQVWISLLTLTFLEIVLGVDNIIFITIASNKLSEKDKPRARNIGLLLAMIFRVILLFGISVLIAMSAPLFHLEGSFLSAGLSGQSIILIAGGIFLLYKSVTEIHHKLEGHSVETEMKDKKSSNSLIKAIIQISLINIVFSFDSILTAVGLTNDIMIMIIAVVMSVLIMMAFAGPVGRFVNKHPTIQMLGLSFLLLIGFMLIVEGAHLGHVTIAGNEIGTVPKGYLYFAIAFSLLVEALNLRLRRKAAPIQLHGISEEAEATGYFDSKAKNG